MAIFHSATHPTSEPDTFDLPLRHPPTLTFVKPLHTPYNRSVALLRYKLTLAYDGSAFHGWQEQNPPGEDPLRTVQAELRHTVQRTLGQPVEVLGASRTDTGVHAMGQTASFTADTRIPLERIGKAINSRLPDDIYIRHVEAVSPDFHVIGDVTNKQYRYRIWNSSDRPLQYRHMVYPCWYDLDIGRMNDAAKRLIGEHDFEGFACASHGRLSTVRKVYDCQVESMHDSPEVHITISGNGFLYNMIRIIAGTLVEVGRGHWSADRIDEIIKTTDRTQAGPTLPPQGLCLEWIKYEGHETNNEFFVGQGLP